MESTIETSLKKSIWLKDNWRVSVIAVAAFIFKIIYVFYFTSFQDSVRNDMAVYFVGAFRHNWGDAMSLSQFAIFPPFYIYLLGFFLQAVFYLGLYSYALHSTIIFHAALHCISSVFLYRMVLRISGGRYAALITHFFFCFSYTALNLNALILPDNLATPLLIIVMSVLVTEDYRKPALFGAGLLLGVVVAAKPSFILFIPIFLWYVYSRQSGKENGVMTVFAAGLIGVLFLAAIENYHISNGKLAGLGVNGGVNFFQGWGRVKKITSEPPDGNFWVYSPGAWDEPNWKAINTKEPFYNQGYFYRRGLAAIAEDPSVLIKKIFWFKKIFFGILGPFLTQLPAGFAKLMFVTDSILYLMFIAGLFSALLIRRVSSQREIDFFLYLIGVFFVSVYLIGMPERRYLSYIEPLITALFFIGASRIYFLYRAYRSELRLLALCVVSFFVCLPVARLLLMRFTG